MMTKDTLFHFVPPGIVFNRKRVSNFIEILTRSLVASLIDAFIFSRFPVGKTDTGHDAPLQHLVKGLLDYLKRGMMIKGIDRAAAVASYFG